MENRILVYGASVSAQKGEQGYYTSLVSLLHKLPNFNQIEISRVTYPSASFSGAGFFCIDIILAINPTILIFDWLSTAEEEFDQLKLINFIAALLKRNIPIIFLNIPRLDSYENSRKNYFQLKDIATYFNLPFIDLVSILKEDGFTIHDVCRDGVHTNEFGAKLYANKILPFIDSLIKNPPNLNLEKEKINSFLNNLNHEKKMNITKKILQEELVLKEGEILNLELIPEKDQKIEIWSSQIIGPFSSLIDAKINDKFIYATSIWDEWCHYQRLAFKPLFISQHFLNDTVNLEIMISNVRPNYEICREKNFDFSESLRLRIIDSFYCLNATVNSIRIRN